MNWHIGQRIVAIASHSTGRVQIGNEFIIRGLAEGICPCALALIDVGHDTATLFSNCSRHNVDRYSDGIFWYADVLFTPLDELEEAITREWEASKEDELVIVER